LVRCLLYWTVSHRSLAADTPPAGINLAGPRMHRSVQSGCALRAKFRPLPSTYVYSDLHAGNMSRVHTKGQRSYPLMADEDLIGLVAGGDVRAFGALYDRHARAALSLARRLSPAGGGQDAEDLMQAAFLGVWRSAGTYRTERGSVRTWLLSTVRNAGVDGFRSAAKYRRARERAGATSPPLQPCEAFAAIWRGAVRERLLEALKALPPEQLEVLRLAYLSGYTQSEISEFLGIPLGTVKGRARLGLEKLRDHLGCR
jgi:RNA polymerase sigma-70 factor, ECF subfamily